MGAVIFHTWEGWDWASAAYFCFITLSTVRMRMMKKIMHSESH